MTDIEKLQARIEAIDAAIQSVTHAMTVDRKMSHDKHTSGHFTKALTELNSIRSQVGVLKVRMETVGR